MNGKLMQGGQNWCYTISVSCTADNPSSSILNQLKATEGSLCNTRVEGVAKILTRKNKGMDNSVWILKG